MKCLSRLKGLSIVTPFFSKNGSALVVALLMTVALSLAVLMAMNNSMGNSKRMRRNRIYRDHLYRAETGISVAAEEHKSAWLAPASKLFAKTTDFVDPENAKEVHENITIKNENNQPITVASYEIGRIEKNPKSGSLSDKLYHLHHQAPPPIGSGSSPKTFEIRRYGIRSRVAPQDTLTIEAGLYKYFNKLK